MDNERLKKQIEFIILIDKMKSVYRRNILIDKSRRETDAEHSWHMAIMAVLLYEYADRDNADLLRVLKMCLVHDIVEIYAGDTFAYDDKGNADKAEREQSAADKIFSVLPDNQGKELRELWEEFDLAETPDALYAAAMDRLQPFILNCNTQGHTWGLGRVSAKRLYERLDKIRLATPALWEYVDGLVKLNIEKGYLKGAEE